MTGSNGNPYISLAPDPFSFSFDQVLIALLEPFGIVGVIIVILVKVAWFVQSWIDGVRVVGTGGRAVGRAASKVAQAVRYNSLYRTVWAIIVTLIVPLAQLLMVYLCYAAGSYYPVWLGQDHDRAALVEQLTLEHGLHVLKFWSPWSIVTYNSTAGIYAAAAIAAIIFSYWAYPLLKLRKWVTLLLVLPVLWWVPVELLFLILFGIAKLLGATTAGSDDSYHVMVYGLMLSAVFCASCTYGIRGAEIIVRAWRMPSSVGENR